MINHGIKSSKSQQLINWACDFAEYAHAEQKRKYTGEPYIYHPIEVAQIVSSVTDDVNAICAAFLHDAVEDTWVNIENLKDQRLGFGIDIANLVFWLTDISKPLDGNRKTRKAIDREHISKAPPLAKTIKLADLISNSRSIVNHDADFAKVYMAEKKLLLDVLTEGDSKLYAMAREIIDEYYGANKCTN